jgi:acetolactate synthase-1/2/3 large subunit
VTGAEAVLRALAAAGVEVCFANPGTSEIHLVAALDSVSELRPVLALFEGVATGAADGYARMAGKPALALLHLGPGLANGVANLHNARRARVPLVLLVGDHPDEHRRRDPPLESDIAALAGTFSGWVRRAQRAEDAGRDAAAAVAAAAAAPGRVATLILPADVSWSEGGRDASAPAPTPAGFAAVAESAVEAAARRLREGTGAALLLGGGALRAPGLHAARRIAGASGARLLSETFPARLERGAGLPRTEPLAYFPLMAAGQLDGLRALVLAGAASPVSFFAYPGLPGSPLPEGCEVVSLASPEEDAEAALEALADRLDPGGWAGAPSTAGGGGRPQRPSGELTLVSAAQAVAALLPEGAIVSHESGTGSIAMFSETALSPPHDWLALTGGAIGQGLPVALGAAVACPGRPVLALQADGASLYTIQSLWTMAREGLDVTVVLLSNRSYALLLGELRRLGGQAGPRSRRLLDLGAPELDFCAIARGMGVPGTRVASADQLCGELERAFAEPGPHLVEVPLPSLF